MLNDKQTGVADYELKEVPKELGDYLCIYQCSRTHFVHINSLENVKRLGLNTGDLRGGYVYVEHSLIGAGLYKDDAEKYLGMPVAYFYWAPQMLKNIAPDYFERADNTTKKIRVVPELSESSKELFGKLETMQTTYQPETDSIEEENMREIKNLNAMMEDFNMNLDVDLNVNIPTWLNTVPTLVWKLDQEANVMLFADEQFDTFTLKDVKNDISLHLTFEQVKNLGIIYSANYD